MRKKTLGLFLAMTTVMMLLVMQIPTPAAAATPSGEPIESAFSDEYFLQAVREVIGKTNGEHIYQSDVESITKLKVIGDIDEAAYNLQGIEYFTGLKELYCYANELTELDLSHNINLEVLDCSYNIDLSSLNISNCPELKDLECNYCGLRELDLRNNPKLTQLICFECCLDTLDISRNNLLETLDAYGMHLLSLDVSNNPKLEFLDCTYNNMPSAASVTGLENCPLLTGEAFCFEPQNSTIETEFPDAAFLAVVREAIGKTGGEPIYESDVEHIAVLDVSGKAITNLQGIEYFFNLQKLDCSDTAIGELDLSHNSRLEELVCYGVDIKALDLSRNRNLKVLDCSYNNLDTLDIANCSQLELLDCNNTDLHSLNVRNNEKLTQLFCNDTFLRKLDISKNAMLEKLDVHNAYLGSVDVSNNPKLKYLDCSYNYLASAESVAGLKNCPLLKGKAFVFEPQKDPGDLIEFAFTDDVFWAAVREIVGKTEGEPLYKSDVENITSLDVSGKNIMSMQGIEYFTALKELDCSDTAIGELDLSHNTELEVLDCYSNYRLEKLNISNCSKLRELDCGCAPLQEIDLKNNPQLTRLICSHTDLKSLDISNNQLLEEVNVFSSYLIKLDVSNNPKLKYLDCAYNNIPSVESVTGLENCPLLTGNAFQFETQRELYTIGKFVFADGGSKDFIYKVDDIGTVFPTDSKAGFEFKGWKFDDIAGVFTELTDELLIELRGHTDAQALAQFERVGGHKTNQAAAVSKPLPADDSENKMPFMDVNESDWFYDGVLAVYQDGLMKGIGEKEFAPNAEISRGMFVTALYRMEGEPQAEPSYLFADVSAGEYFANAAAWANASGIVKGVDTNHFAPNDKITREQLTAVLYRYAQYKGFDVSAATELSGFADSGKISAYAVDAIKWACSVGLINGRTENILAPQGCATRAEVATMLQRFAQTNAE